MAELRRLLINHIQSGGLIVNYSCPSTCRHCLYRCGPSRSRDYISSDSAAKSLSVIRALGGKAIHVGGGEPLMRDTQLGTVLRLAHELGIAIEYVETNSSWFQNLQQATELLSELRAQGLARLLVSISPFHNETIPLGKVKGVIAACRNSGVEIFPWTAEMVKDISAFDEKTPHTLDEYIAHFGAEYLQQLSRKYWISPGGRALSTFRASHPRMSVAELLEKNRFGCRELANTQHYHFDLYGNYIPGLCAGIAIRREDLGGPLDPELYPLISILFNTGIRGLYTYASEGYGFTPSKADYWSKCELCDEIRWFLVKKQDIHSPELQPREYYEEMR